MSFIKGKKVEFTEAADGTLSIASQADAGLGDVLMGAIPFASSAVLTGTANNVAKTLGAVIGGAVGYRVGTGNWPLVPQA